MQDMFEPDAAQLPEADKSHDSSVRVNVSESFGAFILGVLTILLFIALYRSQQRYAALVERYLSEKRIA